ncbi:MAG: hypothetical protein PF444_00470 [Bacteroidales bacterium]|jgi:hypothetical protein|nr:hypothetical protein [Bacteroidales bacterium]
MNEPNYTTEFSQNEMTHYFAAGVVVVVNTPFQRLTMAVNGVVKDRMSVKDMSLDNYTTYIKNIATEAYKMSLSRS